MAQTVSPKPEEELAAPRPARSPLDELSWSQVWHLPVLLLGMGLFATGMYFALAADGPEHNFPDALTTVGMYLKAGNLEEAHAKLDEIGASLDDPAAVDADRARFWQYYGDLNFLQNKANGNAATKIVDANNRRVLEYYDRSETFGREIDPLSRRRYAQTLVALGREDEALTMIDQLRDEPARRRYLVIRSLIEHRQMSGGRDPGGRLAPLILRFREEIAGETDRDARLDQDIWVTGVQAQLMLEAGDPQRAITFLLKRLTRLKNETDDRRLAPLMVQFARAYHMEGSFDDAERWYQLAQQWLEAADPLNAEILVGLGQLALARSGRDNVGVALELFSHAVRNHPSNPKTFPDALIGAADSQARLGAYNEALGHFRLAVAELSEKSRPTDPRRQTLTQTVRSHIDHARDRGDDELALDMLELLLPMYQPKLPADLVLNLAVTHEAIAEARTTEAAQRDPMKTGSQAAEDVRATRLANQQASAHFAKSADYYLLHSKMVTRSQDDAHGLSLWRAARNYDRAQHWDQAIEAYSDFVEYRKSDPLRLRATNHLGKAYMASGQFERAITLFLQMVKDHPHAPETYDSLVPLAQAYMAMDEKDAAVRGLERVVQDHPAITPESQQYKDALIQLGKLLYRMSEDDGAYAVPAIERLTEAVTRYADDSPEGPSLRFLLADAYRKSVPTLDRELASRMSNSEQIALMAERNRRLEQAQMYYNQALNELEARNPATLTPLERLYLRNAYFYQADCAFDRQRYEQAIKLYDTAARRWEHDPASMVALVQIVNARCELGQFQEAKVANDHALWQLKRIPDEKFDDPSLPMSREHWEDWLRWTSELDLFAGADAR